MLADVGQPQRNRLFDQDAEHAAPSRKASDRGPGLLVDALGEEPRELGPGLVEHPDRRVARAGEILRGAEHPLEHDVDVQLLEHAAGDVEYALRCSVHQLGFLGPGCSPTRRAVCAANDAISDIDGNSPALFRSRLRDGTDGAVTPGRPARRREP